MTTLVENQFDTQQKKPLSADFVTPRPPKDAPVTAAPQPSGSGSPGIIAGAANPAPTPVNAPALAQPAYNPERPEVNRATETTSGQLDSLLAGDSPILQRARALAAQQANARGLLNSTMAAEAGTAAMIDRALPIANADANVYDQRARGNADAGNQSLSQGANIAAQMNLQREQQSFQSSERESQNQFAAIQAQLDRAQQTSITQLQAQLQEAINNKSLPQQFAANLSTNTLSAMQAILGNADLTPESKRGAIQNLIDVANSQLAWAATFYNTPMPPLLPMGQTGPVDSMRAVGG
jgi:hypothetical protein